MALLKLQQILMWTLLLEDPDSPPTKRRRHPAGLLAARIQAFIDEDWSVVQAWVDKVGLPQPIAPPQTLVVDAALSTTTWWLNGGLLGC